MIEQGNAHSCCQSRQKHFCLSAKHCKGTKPLIGLELRYIKYFHPTITFFLYICVDFIQGACTESLDGHVQGATNHPPHPWSLWLVNHFPQALLVELWLWVTALIWLAWVARRKNSLTFHCFLTWNSNQSNKISPLYPLVFPQNKSATHPRIGLALGSLLTPSKTASPLVNFRIHWLEHWRCRCSSENLAIAGTFQQNSHRYISVWICKNVATEISLICPLTESRSGSYFLFFFRGYFLFV